MYKRQEQPERRTLPFALSAHNVTFEGARRLFLLPRDLGDHPQLGGAMRAKLGLKAGYVEHNSSYYWLETPELAYTVTPDDAAALVTRTREAREAGAASRANAPRAQKPAGAASAAGGSKARGGKARAGKAVHAQPAVAAAVDAQPSRRHTTPSPAAAPAARRVRSARAHAGGPSAGGGASGRALA